MGDKKRNNPPAAPSEQRRAQFAPHADPKKQGDGDPGPKSTRDDAVNERSPEAPERVEDQSTED
jgi:hypothetical protein